MRILQVTGYYYPEMEFGGQPQKIHALSLGLVRQGHLVDVATLHSRDRRNGARIELEGVTVTYLPWLGRNPWRVPLQLQKLRDLIDAADLVHCYGLYNLLCPAACFHALRQGKPYILEPLGMYVPRGRRSWSKFVYNRLFTYWMGRGARRLIATSPIELSELREVASPDRLTLRRDGINAEEFSHLPPGHAFRESHQILLAAQVVLYLGRMSPVKNLEQLILAFEKASIPGAVLILAGPMLESSYGERLLALIKARGLGERVRYVGPQYGEQKRAALAAANLLVLPSIMESFGIAAAEAVAAGLPVVVTDSCGIAPIVHKRAGLAVPVGLESLADAIRLMLTDSEVRLRYTAEREDALKELCWSQPIQQTEELYKAVLDERRVI